MEQDLDPGVGEGASEQAHDPLVVLQVVLVVGDHLVPVVTVVETAEGVDVGRGEAVADEVLLPDDDQLPGGE